ncbi:EAL domain-containing protein [Sedimenticola hydrogenitrophicus]|uniref:EAL domain-containing protein n=1 Tax=Sedimenticola hydrogenitrophicus TaxID=2967975 RepID=UPI0021A7AB97|nr:EAL domain-containing protein [Sedimenticola hydrogenitrophicus]
MNCSQEISTESTRSITVGDIISRKILNCPPSTPIIEAAAMMWQARCSAIVITYNQLPLGIWTEADALKLDLTEDQQAVYQAVSSVMSRPVKSIEQHATLEKAERLLQLEQIRHLLVIDQDAQPVGLLSQSDLIRAQGVEHDLLLRNISTLLKRPLVILEAHLSLNQAIKRLREVGVDAAAVFYADDAPYGIFTERDFLKTIATQCTSACVGEVASRPLVMQPDHLSLMQARTIFDQQGFRHLGITGAGGKLVGILSFSEILTGIDHRHVDDLRNALRERRIALEHSQENLHLAQQVIRASRDGIMVTDARGFIQSVNPAFTRITGYSAEESIGNTPALLKSGRHDAAFYQQMWSAVHSDGYWAGEVWNRRKNGEIYPEWLSINVIRNHEGEITKLAAILSDITDRKKSEEQIKNLAFYDVLTGLPNRRLFNDRLTVAIANAHRHDHLLGIVFIDLDLFKRINDTLGHGAGDQLLVEVARRIQREMREGDTAARMGGDEFTLLLQEIEDADAAVAMVHRIIGAIAKPITLANNTLYITASIGISIYPHDGNNSETLIRNADTAMYRAKDDGRNSYQLYTATMNATSLEHLAMESNLRKAIKEREFTLHYQAKVLAESGRITGVEALIRWQHAELGYIAPALFIPLAENIGLIPELGDWVLETAINQCRDWIGKGLGEFRIAVNVSARQLIQPEFSERLIGMLQQARVEPRYLELELTESAVMERPHEVIPMLTALKSHGIHISIDDFGTGYSNFGYLKRLPIDKLKIDLSFIRDVPTNRDDAELVAAMIAMAHKLRLSVIAEGVENRQQIDFLKQHHCDELQGYFITRPLPAKSIEPLLIAGTFALDR